MKQPPQISARLLPSAIGTVYLLLFLAPFAPRWVLVYHHVGNLLPEFSSTLFYLADLPLILAVALWLIAHLLDTSRPVRLDPWFITVPLLALMIGAGLSIGWAISPSISAELFVRLAGLVALYLLIRNEVHSWRVAGWVLVAGMVIQATIATIQFFTRRAVGLFFLGEMEALITQPGNWVRGYGLAPNANILAGYLVLGLAATLALALNRPDRRKHFLLLLIFGVGMSGLVSTFSRSAWLGLALGWGLAAAVIFLNPAARARWGLTLVRFTLVGTTIGIMYLVFTPDFFASRLIAPVAGRLRIDASATDHPEMINLAERDRETHLAWELIRTHFPGGVGGANFSLASYLLAPNLPPDHLYLPVHNVPLLLTAELGPAGGFSWIFLAAAFALALWRRRTALAQDPWLLGWSIAALALLTTGFFDFYLWGWQPGRLIGWLTLGLWAGAYTGGHQPPEGFI